jgi:hypothetical protein
MREASNDFVKFWMEDGIMYSRFLKEVQLDLECIQEFIQFRHEFSQGEKKYWLHDMKGLKIMTKDAKEYGDKYGQEFLYAGAIVVLFLLLIWRVFLSVILVFLHFFLEFLAFYVQ